MSSSANARHLLMSDISHLSFGWTTRCFRFWAILPGVLLGHLAILLLMHSQAKQGRMGTTGPVNSTVVMLKFFSMDETEKPGAAEEANSRQRAKPAPKTPSSPPLMVRTEHDGTTQHESSNRPTTQSVDAPDINAPPPANLPLNLALPKAYLAEDGAKRQSRNDRQFRSEPLDPWNRFVRAIGPMAEYREQRLSDDRVRIHTRFGCFELSQGAMKRLDPFNRTPESVSPCRD